MLKKTFIAVTLPLVSLISLAMPLRGVSAQTSSKTATAHSPQRASSAVATAPASGTLQRMIVENGSVTMDLDLNGLVGDGSLVARPAALHFVIGANSFFPILVFNDLLRGPEPGSMALIPSAGVTTSRTAGYNFPATLSASLKQLVVEKLSSGQRYNLAVRDGKTGFTFFNVEGGGYDYDASAQSLSITGGRLLISKEFASALGRPSDAGAIVGKISIGAAMQPIEIDQVVNGEAKSVVMPGVGTVPGPDVIVGELLDFVQYENGEANGFVGLALGTDACNKGIENAAWIALPSNDHPFIPQNLYRMSGGADNTERFEQLGQSWGKHAFAAASSNTCNFGCNGVGGDHLGSGCSDAYGAGLNGLQDQIGSRAWVNPFTGSFPAGDPPGGSNDHTGHNHDVTSHRMLVAVDDLNTSLNPGATYFAEANYIVPDEGIWCQSHPTECNMYNNASYKQFTVVGINQPFSFNPAGPTVREQPAISAWTGATVNQVEPDPGNDGIFFVGYKVTGPNAGLYHYEYAIYNQNLDRAIQSFEVLYPFFPPPLNNVGFHAPPQHPGFAHDGTQGDAGYSSTPWTFTSNGPPPFANSAMWNCETFAQNQNANAIRFGTLYNFRFDSTAPPATSTANIGFFKTGSPVSVEILAPEMSDATPTPAPTATATPTPTPTLTPTSTPTATPTPTPTATVRPSPTPRPAPIPRVRPTPHPRP
jgi:hypothetical protein